MTARPVLRACNVGRSRRRFAGKWGRACALRSVCTLSEVHVHLLWLGFLALVGVLLLLQRKTSALTLRGAAIWFAVGLSFIGLVYPMYKHAWWGATLEEPSVRPGLDASMLFVSAYLLEYALAFDNIIVISLLCSLHRVPKAHQPRVVFWGLVIGIVFRLIVLTGTVSLARAFVGALYLFGILAVHTGIRAFKPDDDKQAWRTDSDSAVVQEKRMPLARMLWRLKRLTDRNHGGSFFVIENGRRVLTMAAACVSSIVLTDVVFALDSAIAIVSVSKTTFIIVTSNILAAIALRSWFSLIGTVEKLRAPQKAIAVLLVVVGCKLLVQNHVRLPHAVWLAVILALVSAAVAEGLLATRRARSL
jgi:tellurite resistance protein TerC